jgi:hypothetical protein
MFECSASPAATNRRIEASLADESYAIRGRVHVVVRHGVSLPASASLTFLLNFSAQLDHLFLISGGFRFFA